jgi:hypothetical protein
LFSERNEQSEDTPTVSEPFEELPPGQAASAAEALAVTDLPKQDAKKALAIEQPTAMPEPEPASPTTAASNIPNTGSSPAEFLFGAVSASMQQLLKTPMKEQDIANALNVSRAQAKVWLQRLVDEGVIQKNKKPVSYEVKQPNFF